MIVSSVNGVPLALKIAPPQAAVVCGVRAGLVGGRVGIKRRVHRQCERSGVPRGRGGRCEGSGRREGSGPCRHGHDCQGRGQHQRDGDQEAGHSVHGLFLLTVCTEVSLPHAHQPEIRHGRSTRQSVRSMPRPQRVPAHNPTPTRRSPRSPRSSHRSAVHRDTGSSAAPPR